jgi:hypothetical protein
VRVKQHKFSANANVLSANFLFSVLPAGGAGMGQVAEMESTLVLEENVYVNLPTPPITYIFFQQQNPISILQI